jgi:hypothetical protein
MFKREREEFSHTPPECQGKKSVKRREGKIEKWERAEGGGQTGTDR